MQGGHARRVPAERMPDLPRCAVIERSRLTIHACKHAMSPDSRSCTRTTSPSTRARCEVTQMQCSQSGGSAEGFHAKAFRILARRTRRDEKEVSERTSSSPLCRATFNVFLLCAPQQNVVKVSNRNSLWAVANPIHPTSRRRQWI